MNAKPIGPVARVDGTLVWSARLSIPIGISCENVRKCRVPRVPIFGTWVLRLRSLRFPCSSRAGR